MKTLAMLLMIVVGAVSASAQKVKVGANPSVDITKFKTFGVEAQGPTSNPLIYQMIVTAVDQALTAKGLTRVETNADVVVVVWSFTTSELHASHPSQMGTVANMPPTLGIGSQSWPITTGMLGIDILDAKSKNSVWRGTASDTLDQGPSGNLAKDAKSVNKKINKAVEKMFKQFPKPSKK